MAAALFGTTRACTGEALGIYGADWQPSAGDVPLLTLPPTQCVFAWALLVVGAPLPSMVDVAVTGPGGVVLLTCAVPAGRLGPAPALGAPALALSPDEPSALVLAVLPGEARPPGILRVVLLIGTPTSVGDFSSCRFPLCPRGRC
jgi:hypothetical protein